MVDNDSVTFCYDAAKIKHSRAGFSRNGKQFYLSTVLIVLLINGNLILFFSLICNFVYDICLEIVLVDTGLLSYSKVFHLMYLKHVFYNNAKTEKGK